MEFKKNYAKNSTLKTLITGVSMTKKAFKNETDINQIIKKYQKTGQLPALVKQNPRYADFSGPQSLMDAYQTVQHAKTQFDALPSRIREKFQNNPVLFLEYANNPANQGELQRLINGEAPRVPSKPLGQPKEPQQPFDKKGEPEGDKK